MSFHDSIHHHTSLQQVFSKLPCANEYGVSVMPSEYICYFFLVKMTIIILCVKKIDIKWGKEGIIETPFFVKFISLKSSSVRWWLCG